MVVSGRLAGDAAGRGGAGAGGAMPFGAELLPGGGVRFRLWAPAATGVELELRRDDDAQAELWPMQRLDEETARSRLASIAPDAAASALALDGWFERVLPQAAAGSAYRFVVRRAGAASLTMPDPASRFNPQGVHGASRVVDPAAYRWRDAGWRGRPWHEAVVYELHVGAFTRQGSFAAAARRLPELAALGVTAIELMPVAAFAGRRGWGYDGVLPFAPHAAYGTPDQLRRLVDDAHALGLMVLLDVVYNHLGPDGNYLHVCCPPFFDSGRPTPWGLAINFDAPGSEAVRAFFVRNALHWIEEYHFDGLRLDAVHAIRDDSPRHIVAEIAQALRDGPGRQRELHLVLENEHSQACLLARDAQGVPRIAAAQWNDEFHHAAHVLATGERDGYYAGFADVPAVRLARTLGEGCALQACRDEPGDGRSQGRPGTHPPPGAFVSFLQNHDQVGNRAFGERLHDLADARRIDALTACLLLSPQVPMLFMGEEFAASTPFLFFCDFEAELAAAVAEGRRHEFSRFAVFHDEAMRARIPDPNALTTFEASRLRWNERGKAPHAQRLALVGELLRLRHRHLTPRLPGPCDGAATHECDAALLQVRWRLGDGSCWRMHANFGDPAVRLSVADPAATIVYASRAAPDGGGWRLESDAVLVTVGDGDDRV